MLLTGFVHVGESDINFRGGTQSLVEWHKLVQGHAVMLCAVERMALTLKQAQEAKRLQDDSARLLKITQEANERLKTDVANAAKIAETIKGGSEQQSQLLSALESQVRKAEAGASKARVENLELRQRLVRAEENSEALSKELVAVKAQLDAELKKSIVQKIFDTK